MSTHVQTELLAGRYELGEVIGRGGMGEVRRAHDTRLGRDVAVKFLRPDLAAHPQIRERFESEARNAGQLTHPNVVTVYDSGEESGLPYIVMECLPGRSLRDEIVKGPIPEAFATAVADDVLAGLEVAHRAGIVHRDIAPSNILLTDDDRAKVADFGIAKATEALSNVTTAGQVLGTPAYLSPARLEGAPATPADDIYALGVVLYEAVTGERLFSGSSPVVVAQTILSSPPPPLREARPDLSPAFAAAVDGAMARESTSRITTASEMRATIHGAASDETSLLEAMPVEQTTAMPVFAPVAGPVVPAWWQRTPREVWVAVAAIVFIGVLVLALANRGDSAAPVTTDASVPTTITPVPTTVAPSPTTEAVVPQGVQVQFGPAKGHGHGKGRG